MNWPVIQNKDAFFNNIERLAELEFKQLFEISSIAITINNGRLVGGGHWVVRHVGKAAAAQGVGHGGTSFAITS